MSLLANGKLSGMDFGVFVGTMPSSPGSWARFTIFDGRATGILFDGTTLFIVDRAAHLNNLLPVSAPDGATVVVKASDLYLPIDSPLSYGSATGEISAKDMIARSTTIMAVGALNQPRCRLSEVAGLLKNSLDLAHGLAGCLGYRPEEEFL